jgi:DNA-binding transcriptional ArsR family regulator
MLEAEGHAFRSKLLATSISLCLSSTMTYDYAAIVALADPTRRKVFEMIAERPRSVVELTRSLPVSQPAVSQSLKVLKEAQLVRAEPRGASNIYHLDPQGLGQMRAWLDRMWADALDAFRKEINATEEKEKEKRK